MTGSKSMVSKVSARSSEGIALSASFNAIMGIASGSRSRDREEDSLSDDDTRVSPVPRTDSKVIMASNIPVLCDSEDAAMLSSVSLSKDRGEPMVCIRRRGVILFPVAYCPIMLDICQRCVAPKTETVDLTVFVWLFVLRRPVPEGMAVRTINGKKNDVRRENLIVRAGNHEDPEDIHQDFTGKGVDVLPYRVVLRGVKTMKNVQLAYRVKSDQIKAISHVKPETFAAAVRKAINILTYDDPEYPEKNENMMRLLSSYREHIAE